MRRSYPITDEAPGSEGTSGRHAIDGGHAPDDAYPAAPPRLAADGYDADRYLEWQPAAAPHGEVDRYAAAAGHGAGRPGGARSARGVDPYGADLFAGDTGAGDPRGGDPGTDPFGWEPVAAEAPAGRRPGRRGDTGPIPRQRGRDAEPGEAPRRPRSTGRSRDPARAGAASGPAAASRRAATERRKTPPRAAATSRAGEEVSRPERTSRAAPLGDLPGPRLSTVAVPVVIGTLVAVALGVWARDHDPTGVAVNLAGFSGALAVKTWLATAAMALGLVQLWSALVVSGRIGRGATPLVRWLHRWSGRAAVLVTVPVAVQCLIALGWSGATPRALAHSLLGCLFYGAFATKMLLLRRPGVPGWAMAVAGGLVFAVLTGIWLTSAAWFFGTYGITF